MRAAVRATDRMLRDYMLLVQRHSRRVAERPDSALQLAVSYAAEEN